MDNKPSNQAYLPDEGLTQREYIAPETATEKALVDIWARLVNEDPASISVLANFFELGGHSLLSVQMISLIEQKLGCTVAMKDVFEYPVLKTLAGWIDSLE